MQEWYNQQHWLIQALIRCLAYTVFFFLFDLLITNNIGWFEQDETLKEMLFEALWMGSWFGITFPLISRSKYLKKLVPKQHESAGN
jgi:hypothetical protein